MQSTHHGAVRIGRRCDLQITPRIHETRTWYMVKDPVSLRYYLLREEEHFILQELNGEEDPDAIRQRFAQRFGRHLDSDQYLEFLAHLQRSGLIATVAPGEADRIWERAQSLHTRWWQKVVANPLAIRLPGFNPQPWLTSIYPWLRWCYRWPALIGSLCAIGLALLLVTVEFDTLHRRWPEFHTLFTARNCVSLMAAVAVVKIVHELAHAFTCHHFGARCHEMGILLLAGIPCLYCDVTDAWTISRRAPRIAIAAAGMYVELVIAALATFIWWQTPVGPLHVICQNLMIVCSVQTLLVNGNPLLRYDGYYIMADWLNMPNLWSRSRAFLYRTVVRALWGAEDRGSATDPLPEQVGPFFFGYALVSILYQTIVAACLLYALCTVLGRYGLEAVGLLLVALFVWGLVVRPMSDLFQQGWQVARRKPPKAATRMAVWGTIAGIVISLLTWLPVRQGVVVPATIEAEGAQGIYVRVPGTILTMCRPGDRVTAGQVIGQLRNWDVSRRAAAANAEYEQQRMHLHHLQMSKAIDPQARRQIPATEEIVEKLARQREDLQREEAELTLLAPVSGAVFPPPRRVRDVADKRLPGWDGTPLDSRNRGSYLESRTLVCSIGDPQTFVALLELDSHQIESVSIGQPVRVRLSSGAAPLSGTISDIAEVGTRVTSADIIRELRSDRDSPSRELRHPVETRYLARVLFDEPKVVNPLRVGMRGYAKIDIGRRALGVRIWNSFRRFAVDIW